MRPLLVLLLVLGAVGALVLALDPFGGDSPEETGISDNGPGQPAPVVQDPGPEPTDLVGDAPDQDEDSARSSAADPAASGVTPIESVEGQGSLVGRMVDQNGNGIADAKVTLTRVSQTNFLFMDGTEPDRSKDEHTTSDSTGRFEFLEVDAYDQYAIIARHEDFSPIEYPGVIVHEGGLTNQPPITMVPGVRLYGIVRDIAGNRIPGADLTLRPTVLAGSSGGDDDPNIVRRSADDDGNYGFPNLATGNYLLTVHADGYGSVTVPQINIGTEEDVMRDVTMKVAMALGGIVLDKATQQPLPGVRVMAFSIGDRESRTQTQADTDAQGNFLMQDIPEGSYAVRANKPGYRAFSVMRVSAGEMTLTIELEAVPKIRGVVLDRFTNQPLRRFSVQLRRADHSPETSVKIGRPVEFNTKDGRFEIDCEVAGSNPGTYLVGAAAPGYAMSLSDPIQVQHGSDVENVTVLATPGGRIRGRVVDDKGKPVVRAKITTRSNEWTGGPFDQVLGDSFPGVATKRSVRTNDKGEFTVPNLTATTYLIMVEPGEHAHRALKNIEVNDGKETDVGDVLVMTGATVSGTVRGPSGKALAGATVSLVGEQLGQEFAMQLTAKTDVNGKYEVKHINPGAYFIAASRPPAGGGQDPFGSANDHRKTRRRITLENGRNLVGEDFELPN